MCLGRDAKGRPVSDESEKVVKILTFIGRDSKGLTVYEDKKGILWKDINPLCNGRYFESSFLYTCRENDVEGDPEDAMSKGVFVVFVPNRMH